MREGGKWDLGVNLHDWKGCRAGVLKGRRVKSVAPQDVRNIIWGDRRLALLVCSGKVHPEHERVQISVACCPSGR